MEEQQVLTPENNYTKYLWIVMILAIIIIIITLFFILKTSKKGIDLAITDVSLSKDGNFTIPTLKIKNLGNQESNSSFLIMSELESYMGIQWQVNEIIPANKEIQVIGAGFKPTPETRKITFTLDSLNQTSDIDRKNNIFTYNLN